MKYFSLTIYFAIMVSLFSCKKDNDDLPAFKYEQAVGLWVPQEAIDKDGATVHGPFTANSLFGSYAESVHLNNDQTFTPVTWFDKDSFTLKNAETGNFKYLSTNKLIFEGGLFDFECDIIKFQGDDLWLRIFELTYKFKRQH